MQVHIRHEIDIFNLLTQYPGPFKSILPAGKL
jgi:hypothetical protein